MSLNWNILDEHWKNRHDAARLSELESALDKALYNQGDKPEYAILWRWARLSHFRAMQARENLTGASGKTAALNHYAAGAHEGMNAARLQPNRVEGHFWGGVNALEAGRLRGAVAQARALPQAARHIDRAAQIDEAFHFAGPLRVQGRITHLKPLLLGGSLDRALDIYRRALQIAPDNSTTLLYFAAALEADRQRAEARTTLNRLVAAPPDPDWTWEQIRDKRQAVAMLQKMDTER